MSEMEAEPLRSARSITLVGALVNIILIVLKFLAGVFGHSQALIADAVHSVSDLFTDIVVLVGLKFARKAPDAEHPFGHARLETLGSAIVGLALIATAIYLGLESSLTIYHHTEYHPTALALIGAGLSIASKEALYRYTVHIGRRIRSPLVVANAWHHRSDALSSVAVLLGVAGARFRPSWHILDAYAALLVSFFIVKVGLDVLWESLREFTDTSPGPDVLAEIKRSTLSVDGVIGAHDLKVRTSGGRYQMELHIVVDGRITVHEGHSIAKAVEGRLGRDIENLDRITVHLDPAKEGQEVPRNGPGP